MRQSALIKGKTPHPYNTKMPSLSWGKIVHRNSDNTVDVALQNGSTYQHVQIGANTLGSQVGNVYIPTHGLTNPVQTSSGVWDSPVDSTKGDLYVVLGFLDGMSRQPKILGFFNPQQTEMSFSTLGLQCSRHESGVYDIILPSGFSEKHFPDGSYIASGGTSSYDMKQENPNWNPPTQNTPMPFTFHHSSGTTIEIDTTGKLTINPVNGVEIGGTEAVALANLVQAAFNSHTHNAPSGGGTTSGPTPNMSNIASSNLTTS